MQFCNNCQIDKIPIVSVKSEAIITEVYTQICSCRRPVLESCSRADCLQKVSTVMQHHAEVCRLLCQSWTVYKVTENGFFFLNPSYTSVLTFINRNAFSFCCRAAKVLDYALSVLLENCQEDVKIVQVWEREFIKSNQVRVFSWWTRLTVLIPCIWKSIKLMIPLGNLL